MPIAVVMYDRVLDTWAPGAHTGTFRGNQLAFAAGLAAARIIQRDGILEHVRSESRYIVEQLDELQREYPLIGDIRAAGLMIGMEIVDPETGDPRPETARAIQHAAFERGLIVELGGRFDAVVRFLPPLNVARETVDQALDVFREALAESS
jgi:diaminobutyrate-2-oxoglutarate transaminase